MTSCGLPHFLSIHVTLASIQESLLFWNCFHFLGLKHLTVSTNFDILDVDILKKLNRSHAIVSTFRRYDKKEALMIYRQGY